MNLTALTSTQLKEVADLVDERENLRAAVEALDHRIADILAHPPAHGSEKPPRSRAPRRSPASRTPQTGGGSPRNHLKDQILTALRQSKASGLTIKELSRRLDVKVGSLYTWFSSTGKRVAGLEKVEPGRYRFVN